MVTVGILAVQGDFEAHRRALGAPVRPRSSCARPPTSTASTRSSCPGASRRRCYGARRDGLEAPLAAFVRSGRPVLGTCAGAILLARTSPIRRSDPSTRSTSTSSATATARNDSFACDLDGDGPFAGLRAVFIRAPRITRVGPGVEMLASVDGRPVLVRSGRTWAATFHPELTDDDRLVRSWLSGVQRLE